MTTKERAHGYAISPTTGDRVNVGAQIHAAMTAIMDEEAVLEAGQVRRNLLADCGDFRAPFSLAIASLSGFERSGDEALFRAFQAMLQKAMHALERIRSARDALTSTQKIAFARVEELADPLLNEMSLRACDAPPCGHGVAPDDPSFTIAASMFDALSAMLDAARHLEGTPEHKRIVALLVGTRGPLGLAIAHLRDYVELRRPASRRLFQQACRRIATDLNGLRGHAAIFSQEQSVAFAVVEAEWARLGDAAGATLRAADARDIQKPALARQWALAWSALLLCVTPPLALALWQDGTATLSVRLVPVLPVAVLTAAAGAFTLTRFIFRPLRDMVDRLEGFSRCEALDEPIAPNAAFFFGAAPERLRMTLSDLQDALAEADVNLRTQTVERRASMLKIANSFQLTISGIVAALSATSTQMAETAQNMTIVATETAVRSLHVAQAAKTTSLNVSTVAGAADALSAAVEDLGQQVNGSASLSARAARESDGIVASVNELSASVAAIGNVTSLISAFADQTNLLALNATIEAARAGEAGRGFAIVASEIKELSTQTMGSTREIAAHIARIETSSGRTIEAIGGIAERVRDMAEVSTAIATSIDLQSKATQDITRNVMAAARGTGEVTTNIEDVATLSEDTQTAAAQALTSASDLRRQFEHLDTEVASFLAMVRAA